MKAQILPILFVLLFFSACANSIKANTSLTPRELTSFSHDNFNAILREYVNKEGRLDYGRLKEKQNDTVFENYYASISEYSPDATPELFKDENEKLAYWVNAYNASVIKTVLEHYPINSISDVKAPFWAFALPEMSGFFLFQRHKFGGAETNLFYLENKVIRARFKDPRIHFALNCASIGCPSLPDEAFLPLRLDEQFEREAKKFFGERRNLYIDKENKKIRVSSILQWYEKDFTSWVNLKTGKSDASIRDYIAIYASSELRAFIDDDSFTVDYLPYDWGLNNQ